MTADQSDLSADSWLSAAEAGSVAAASEPFSVLIDQPDADAVVVCVAGEIDLLTAPVLHDQLSRVLAAGPSQVVIDLTHVSFLDATALSVFITLARAAAQQGTTLHLQAPTRPLLVRSLNITGLGHLFDIGPPASDPNGTHAHPLRSAAEVSWPRAAPYADSAPLASGESVIDTGDEDEYARLVPLQRRYAELAADDPQRHQLRHQLIQGYRPVAEHIARRFTGRGEPLEDLVQIATVGLINAIDRFDPARGSHFLAFAVPTITGEIRRYFRDHGWSVHVPRRLKDLTLAIRQATAKLSQQLGHCPRPSQIAQQLGLPTHQVLEALHAAEAYQSSSLDDMLSWGDITEAAHRFLGELDPQLRLADDRETLRTLLAQLTPRQRTILTLRFFHQLTQHQIGKQIGVSQMHVSRPLRQILNFLQQQVADPKKSSNPHERRTRLTALSSTDD